VGRRHDVSPSAGGEHLTSGLLLWLSMPLCFSHPLHGLSGSLLGQREGEAWPRKWADVVESKCPCALTFVALLMITGRVNSFFTPLLARITIFFPVEEYVQHEHIHGLPLSSGFFILLTGWEATRPSSCPENPSGFGHPVCHKLLLPRLAIVACPLLRVSVLAS